MRCTHCRSVCLVPGRYFEVVTSYTAELPCPCGESADGVAARRRFRQSLRFQEWGRPGGGPGEEAECREEVERRDEDGDVHVFCPACVAAADAAAWSVTAEDQCEPERDRCRFVYCLRCGSETIFV